MFFSCSTMEMADKAYIRSKLYTIVKEQQLSLSSSNHRKDVNAALGVILALVDQSITSSILSDAFSCAASLGKVRQMFKDELYENTLSFLLNCLCVDFVKAVMTEENRNLFDKIFLCNAEPTTVLFSFCHFVRDNG